MEEARSKALFVLSAEGVAGLCRSTIQRCNQRGVKERSSLYFQLKGWLLYVDPLSKENRRGAKERSSLDFQLKGWLVYVDPLLDCCVRTE